MRYWLLLFIILWLCGCGERKGTTTVLVKECPQKFNPKYRIVYNSHTRMYAVKFETWEGDMYAWKREKFFDDDKIVYATSFIPYTIFSDSCGAKELIQEMEDNYVAEKLKNDFK